jgi:hypothetical protein
MIRHVSRMGLTTSTDTDLHLDREGEERLHRALRRCRVNTLLGVAASDPDA